MPEIGVKKRVKGNRDLVLVTSRYAFCARRVGHALSVYVSARGSCRTGHKLILALADNFIGLNECSKTHAKRMLAHGAAVVATFAVGYG